MEEAGAGVPRVTGEDLARALDTLCVAAGDSVVVHSSLSSFGYVEGGAGTIIAALLRQVGPRGTVLMPAFVQRVGGRKASYRKRAAAWDIKRSPSDVGLVTEVFRRAAGVARSDHPTDSLCIHGPSARALAAAHGRASGRPSPWDERAFGHGSPWEFMCRDNSHYILMGVDFRACSILHFVQALYAEKNGLYKTEPMTWPGFDFSLAGEKLETAGLITTVRVGNSTWRHARARRMVERVLAMLESGAVPLSTAELKLYGE